MGEHLTPESEAVIREKKAKSVRRLYARRRAQHQCPKCGTPSEEGYILCKKHRETRNTQLKEAYRRGRPRTIQLLPRQWKNPQDETHGSMFLETYAAWYPCPSCKKSVAHHINADDSSVYENMKFCPWCGVKIIWKEATT